MSSENRVNLAVVGSGPAGLAAALGLAGLGQPCRLIGPAPDPNDPRTAALFTGSIAMLRHLGVWDACRAASAPIRAIRIVDDTGGLLRAPETLFTAAEAGEDAVADGVLGYNVPNAALTRALVEKVRAEPRLEWTAARVAGIAIDADTARMMLDSGATYRPGLCARLVAAADGRGSLCRAAAGIGTRTWTHDQAALVTSFTHGRPHHDISTELHRRGGPLTVVPLPGRASSLVWVDRPAPIAALAALDDAGFRASLEGRLQGLLGSLGEIAPRRAFQLSGMTATRFAASRVALVGDEEELANAERDYRTALADQGADEVTRLQRLESVLKLELSIADLRRQIAAAEAAGSQ